MIKNPRWEDLGTVMLHSKFLPTYNYSLICIWSMKIFFQVGLKPSMSWKQSILKEKKILLAIFLPFSWRCLPNLWHMGISHLVNIFSCSLWHETLIIRRIYTRKITATAGDIYQLELQFFKTLYPFFPLQYTQSNYLW